MTKDEFYEFSKLMAQDSSILFDNESWHNSVYLGAFVLEAYIKILLIDTAPNSSYVGHISSTFVQRLNSTSPSVFNNSILNTINEHHPNKLLSSDYDINFRYEVERWSNQSFAEEIQEEVINVQSALAKLRMDGILS